MCPMEDKKEKRWETETNTAVPYNNNLIHSCQSDLLDLTRPVVIIPGDLSPQVPVFLANKLSHESHLKKGEE